MALNVSTLFHVLEELQATFAQAVQPTCGPQYSNDMIGQYVIVRCRDAGVHAGVLESHHGRECILTESRRLWRWAPKSGKWLSAVANNGLDEAESKISQEVPRIHLTENCEIILCSEAAEKSIRSVASDD
jgi:hypothetical protein